MRQNNNVITFFSSAGNIGTTTTTFSAGMALAQRTHGRVGILCLNGSDDSQDYFESPPAYLDTLKSRLAGRMLTDDGELLARFKEVGNDGLYILAGNRNRRLDRVFTVEEAEYLIERASEVFDVVLIDAGCHLDNALSVQAIYSADRHIVVLNQQPKTLKRFMQIHEDLLHPLGIEKEKVQLVINQYQSKAHLLTDKQIAKELEVLEVRTLPVVENGMLAELDSRILYSYNSPKYQHSIMTLAIELGEEMQLEFRNEEAPKKKFFQFFQAKEATTAK